MDKETLLYKRPFDADPYLTELDVRVSSCLEKGGKYAVVFDRTIFFPRGGGQPCDEGTAGGVTVEDTFEEEGEIVHILPSPLEAGSTVRLTLEPSRRLGHMRSHLAQHIISATITRLYHNDTSAARIDHLGGYIELPRPLTPEELSETEAEANAIVARDLSVTAEYHSPAEAAGFEVRGKITPHELIRLVTVEGFDINACGGTHCKSTGEIGDIALTGTKEVRGVFRVYFSSGDAAKAARAARPGELIAIQQALGAETAAEALSSARELTLRAERLDEERLALKARLEESDALWLEATGEKCGDTLYIMHFIPSDDVKHYRSVAARLVKAKAAVALALESEGELTLLLERPKGPKTPDMGACVRELTSVFGGKGGGSPVSAQCTLPRSDEAIVMTKKIFNKIKEDLQ